jgi:hypothetical protein
MTSIFIMSQTLNFVPAFDGSNYGYWRARMRFFLKSIDCWGIVETGWTKPENTTLELVTEKNARLSNDKALHALCQALSPSEFAKISNCESAKAAWQILETAYEGTKLVKSATHFTFRSHFNFSSWISLSYLKKVMRLSSLKFLLK